MHLEESDQSRWFADHLQPHESMLRSWLNRRFPDADNIDEIVQDSFIRTLKARGSKTISSPKSFLFTTARNLAIDHLRSHKVARKVPMVDQEFSNVIDMNARVPEEVARRQEVLIMKEAIGALPDRCREIFVMNRIEGIPPREIAQKLGLSVQTVSNQLQKGLSRCTRYVEQYCKEWKGGSSNG